MQVLCAASFAMYCASRVQSCAEVWVRRQRTHADARILTPPQPPLTPGTMMNESKKNKQLSDQIISHYTSENLFETGMIDMVVDRENHRSVLAHIMGLLSMSNRITKRKTPTIIFVYILFKK